MTREEGFQQLRADLETEKARHEKAKEQHEKTKEQHKRKKAEHEKRVHALTEQNKEVERENTALELKISDLDQRIFDKEAQHKSAFDAARQREANLEERAEQLALALSARGQEIDGLHGAHAERLGEVEERHAARVREMEIAHADAVSQVEAEADVEHEEHDKVHAEATAHVDELVEVIRAMKAEHGIALESLRSENLELAQEVTELTSNGLALSDDEEPVDQLSKLELQSTDVTYLRKLSQELSAESTERAQSLALEKKKYADLETNFAELQTTLYHERDVHIETSKNLDHAQVQLKVRRAQACERDGAGGGTGYDSLPVVKRPHRATPHHLPLTGPPPTAHRLPPTAHRPPPTAHRPPPTTHRPRRWRLRC